MPDISELVKKPTVSEFIGKLFTCRDIIHLAHLKTKSYAQHVALGGYYDGLLDLIDTLSECYQGLYGLQTFNIPTPTYQEPIKYISDVYRYIDQNRSIFKESFLQNIIDEIQALNAQTLYKLKNLE